jgi:aminoglycoside phosphotransferase (APT) family kinase protein
VSTERRDVSSEFRSGDTPDVTALAAWLSASRPDLVPAGTPLTLRQFPAGFSNLTFLVRAAERAYVLRRPPHGVASGIAHNMGREHDLLDVLWTSGIAVPRPLARCDDVQVIGAPFYVMEYVDGVILRGAQPSELPPRADDARAALRRLSETFVATLAQLHAVDVTSATLSELGRPDGYVQRQVDGWTRRWHASRIDDVVSVDRVAAWLSSHQPSESAAALIHNDFKFDNLVLDRADLSRVVAILDWEMATIGDPLMDLGTSLAYWVERDDPPIFRALGLGVTALPGSMSRADLVQAYSVASGRDVGDVAFYYTFGLFKVAVIAQQIYARHRRGLTNDPRFARLGDVVAALGAAAERASNGQGLA